MGTRAYVGAMQMVDDFLALMRGDEIDDARGALYAEAMDDGCHGAILESLIRRSEERHH